jgi:hypothetical protein
MGEMEPFRVGFPYRCKKVAHAALNYDAANRYSIFEPVCTHPDHR